MPKSMEVPCEDCGERKREIEEDGMWEAVSVNIVFVLFKCSFTISSVRV